MFYVIRTLPASGTKILCKKLLPAGDDGVLPPAEYGFDTKAEAFERAATVPGRVDVYELPNDAAARMALDCALPDWRLPAPLKA